MNTSILDDNSFHGTEEQERDADTLRELMPSIELIPLSISNSGKKQNYYETVFQLHKSMRQLRFKKESINLNKSEVNLKNHEDQQGLITILKKEMRSKKELLFVDKAVCSLKFFAEKKTQLNDKLYIKLLEKLKYQYCEKEKPLFFHGDKGDKFYIVLRGSLVLLLPPKHFEDQVKVDESAVLKLKEKYRKVMEVQDVNIRTFQLISDDNSPKVLSKVHTPRMAQIIKDKFKAQVASLRHISSTFSQMAQIQNEEKQISSQNKPLLQQTQVQSKDPPPDKQKMENVTFELYCQAFFPSYKQAFEFNQGTAFGEIALIGNTERSGTVVTKQNSHLITLDRKSFEEILGCWERQKTEGQINFLRSFHFLKEVTSKQLMGLLHSLKIRLLSRNDVIYSEENSPDFVYLIKSGEVEFFKLHHSQPFSQEDNTQDQPTEIIIGELGNRKKGEEGKKRVKFSVLSEHSYFGDEEILLDELKRKHMAKVLSTKAELWAMDKKSFISILKQQRILKSFQDQCLSYEKMRQDRLYQIASTVSRETKSTTQQKALLLQIHLNDKNTKINTCSKDILLKEAEEKNSENPQSCRKGVENIEEKANQILNIFSRNSIVGKLEDINSSNMKILSQITKKNGYLNQPTSNSTTEEQSEENQQNFSHKKSRSPLPFSKNLIYQPQLTNSKKRFSFKDPFQFYDEEEQQQYCNYSTPKAQRSSSSHNPIGKKEKRNTAYCLKSQASFTSSIYNIQDKKLSLPGDFSNILSSTDFQKMRQQYLNSERSSFNNLLKGKRETLKSGYLQIITEKENSPLNSKTGTNNLISYQKIEDENIQTKDNSNSKIQSPNSQPSSGVVFEFQSSDTLQDKEDNSYFTPKYKSRIQKKGGFELILMKHRFSENLIDPKFEKNPDYLNSPKSKIFHNPANNTQISCLNFNASEKAFQQFKIFSNNNNNQDSTSKSKRATQHKLTYSFDQRSHIQQEVSLKIGEAISVQGSLNNNNNQFQNIHMDKMRKMNKLSSSQTQFNINTNRNNQKESTIPSNLLKVFSPVFQNQVDANKTTSSFSKNGFKTIKNFNQTFSKSYYCKGKND